MFFQLTEEIQVQLSESSLSQTPESSLLHLDQYQPPSIPVCECVFEVIVMKSFR